MIQTLCFQNLELYLTDGSNFSAWTVHKSDIAPLLTNLITKCSPPDSQGPVEHDIFYMLKYFATSGIGQRGLRKHGMTW